MYVARQDAMQICDILDLAHQIWRHNWWYDDDTQISLYSQIMLF